MPRLLGVEIPADKRIEASLTYIYGIGLSTAKRILEQTNIDPNLRAKNLSPQQLNDYLKWLNQRTRPTQIRKNRKRRSRNRWQLGPIRRNARLWEQPVKRAHMATFRQAQVLNWQLQRRSR